VTLSVAIVDPAGAIRRNPEHCPAARRQHGCKPGERRRLAVNKQHLDLCFCPAAQAGRIGTLASRIPLSSQEAFRRRRNAGENMGADYLSPDTVRFEINHPGLALEHFLSAGQMKERTMSKPPKIPVSISGPVATDQLI
jgi:hypothetical protein